ncbi:MAG: hypothetical protein COA86_07895 [Kangiella sp.]|nr:MAG: hypothetical protein COA86_07895 [Kangiella sp.]
MGITERMMESVTKVIRLGTKFEILATNAKEQQQRIETLTERVIKLEVALDLSLNAQSTK